MIDICLTCANNRARKCSVFRCDIIDNFICDFYVQKRSGALRRKWAKVSKGFDVTYLGTTILGKEKSRNMTRSEFNDMLKVICLYGVDYDIYHDEFSGAYKCPYCKEVIYFTFPYRQVERADKADIIYLLLWLGKATHDHDHTKERNNGNRY